MVPPSRHILAVIVMTIAAGQARAELQLPGRVLRVTDGDSLVLDVRGSLYRVELTGIDAPELNQPWGNAAAERLNTMLTGKFVVITGDAMGPAVHGTVRFANHDVALDLLYDGLAWATIPPGPPQSDPHPYMAAQDQARAAHRGLWSDPQPIAPWDWRAGRSHLPH